MMDTEQLVAQVNVKIATSFKELFVRFYGPLVYYCSTYVRRREVAEDIVQDSFGRLWESNLHFTTWNSLTTYLYTTVRNASLDHIKHLKVERRYGDDRPETRNTDMEYDIMREDMYRLLFNVTEELPPRCRKVLRLYMHGYDGPQIAQMLDLSIDTVHTHRKNALRIMRDKMAYLSVLILMLDHQKLF